MLIELDAARLTWAVGLIAIAVGLSLWQRLELEKDLIIATVRATVQLLAVGYVLAVVFAWRNPVAVVLVVLVMLSVAALVTRNRISKKIPRFLPIIWGSLLSATALTLAYTNLMVLRPETWYEPQYFIPLAGIVLGNAMNGAAIAGERLFSTMRNNRLEIETHLSLGATPQAAIAHYRRDAIRAGLIPTINAMMIVGIVTLPGIITGQILGGADPMNAALYQLLILFMLTFADLLTAILVTWGLARSFFNEAAQLVGY